MTGLVRRLPVPRTFVNSGSQFGYSCCFSDFTPACRMAEFGYLFDRIRIIILLLFCFPSALFLASKGTRFGSLVGQSSSIPRT
ncbi:hypothetical protein SNOG_10488 [Parastagonospora nodorum SN15]|uniref:Uncharacterized protein n=1 Tax=Phaeosphaeria nodorum (strain SN15 / ATCC MYA-4574 / FGSC 10173) TaxID=321614 RepID=Q0UCM6_PHANO|nr:hypothetical protein SNOG_10488 [Parastagonospora nodorum SN15]EAT81882.1 hypothetical protein SNOG_10488 [Parastagonospora nodorum SN15]